MSPKLRWFLIAVGGVAAVLLAVTAPGLVSPRWPHYLVWMGLCLLAETMTTEAPDRHGTWSLSSTKPQDLLSYPCGTLLAERPPQARLIEKSKRGNSFNR